MSKLILVPTPIDEESPLESVAKEMLIKAATDINSVFVVEEIKIGRRRWIKFGLPRECIDHFILLNEHTTVEMTPHLLQELKKGKNVYLMSDGGLPAFMDPGRQLVCACHEANIQVSSTPFCNSISLALALSGIAHERFLFEGYLPAKKAEREQKIKEIMETKLTVVLLDTPYRLKATLEDFKNLKRRAFLAMDLNTTKEELCFGKIGDFLKKLTDFKREFVLIIE